MISALAIQRYGKYHVVAPSFLSESSRTAFFVDSNFILATLELTKPNSQTPLSSVDIDHLGHIWKEIGDKPVISAYSVSELAWVCKGNQSRNLLEIGNINHERFRKFESRFQNIASVSSNIRESIFNPRLSAKERQEILSECHRMPRSVDEGVLASFEEIAYQEWATVLILMRHYQGINESMDIDTRISKFYSYFQELLDRGIGRTGETSMLSQFVFFGGTVLKLGNQEPVTTADLLKTDLWERQGVLKIARNIAFDLVFLRWTRQILTGSLLGTAKNVALITGDRALVAFANQLQLEGSYSEPEHFTYRIPADSRLQEKIHEDGSSDLLQPEIRSPKDLIAAKDIRKELVRLAKLVSVDE